MKWGLLTLLVEVLPKDPSRNLMAVILSGDGGLAKIILLKGGHHFGGDYEAIAETILREVK
jgi:type IV secretory pathway VirJ component